MAYLEDFLKEAFARFVTQEVAAHHSVPSQADFAKYLGVPYPSYNQWSIGQRAPAGKNLHKLAEKLGPEVYEILGEPRLMPDDPAFNILADRWHELNDEQARQMIAVFNELLGEEDDRRNKPKRKSVPALT